MLSERVKEWEKRWKEQGLEQGLERGLERGRAEMVVEALEVRFGSLDEELRARVLGATRSQLSEWLRRTMTADRLEDVLDS